MTHAMPRKTSIPETSQWQVYLSLALLMVTMLSAVGYSLYSGNKAAETYAPLVDAAMEIKLEATVGHLWFEEVLSGDRHQDIEMVWQHLDQSAWYAQAMLEGGTNEEGTFIPLVDPGLRRQIEEVLHKLVEFRTVAEQRFAALEGAAAGSDIDEQFDAVFRNFMTQADHVETALQKLMNRERIRFITMQSLLALLCLALAILVVFVIRHERKRVLSALQEVGQSEERLRLNTTMADVAVWEYQVPENRLLRSANHDALYGWDDLGECGLDTFLKAQIPEDRAAMDERVRQITAPVGPDKFALDFRIVWPDESLHWLSVSGEMVARDNTGAAILMRGCVQDITERKQTEEALADQKQRVEYILQGTNVGTWEWNVQTGEVIFNERWAEIVGYTLEELSPVSIETWTSFCHPDDLEESTRLLQQCFAGERAYYNFEARMRHKNGDWVWVLDRGKVGSWTDDGQPLWMYGTHQDISEQKRGEQAVVAERDLSRQYLDVAGVLMVALDSSQKVSLINPRGCDILGAPREKIIGKNWFETFVPPEQVEQVKATYDQLMRGELEPVEYYENPIVRADGAQRIISWHNSILKDNEGKITGLLSSGDDITERINTAQALHESEEHARVMADLVTNSEQPVAVGYLDGRLGRLNPAFCKLVGYTEEELQAIDWSTELTPPEWAPAEREALTELGRTGRPIRYEKEYIRKDGTRVLIELFVHLIRDEAGEPDYYYAFITDITERKRAEEELRRSESQLKASQKTARLGTWELDLSTGQITWSDELYRVFGMKPGEVQLTYESLRERVHPEDRAYQDQVTEQIATQGSARFEYRVVHPNGDIRWVAGRGESSLDETGNPVQIFGIAQDITERKLVEEELRRESSMLQLALEASHTGAWYLSLIDHTSHRTLGHDEIFGYSEPVADWTYELFLEHVLPEDREEVDRKFQEAIASETDWNFECRIRRPDGEVRWIWAVGRLDMVRDRVTRIMGGVVQDITERKLAAQELQQSHDLLEQRVEERTLELKMRKDEAETLNRAMINLLQDLKETNLGLETTKEALRTTNSELEAFSYSVSHDLRAPLRAVDGYTRMLTEDYGNILDDEGLRICSVISKGARDMGQLIDDLLSFSRFGRAAIEPSGIDMTSMARAIFFELTTPEQRDQVEFILPTLPQVIGDPSLMRQVWTNLFSNALKFSLKRERAIVEVSAVQRDDEVVYCVRDNGAGFDMRYANKLFGVFQRLHSTKEFAGTGVGLAIVQRIIVRHGGRVWAEGQVDHGASFYFALKGEREHG